MTVVEETLKNEEVIEKSQDQKTLFLTSIAKTVNNAARNPLGIIICTILLLFSLVSSVFSTDFGALGVFLSFIMIYAEISAYKRAKVTTSFSFVSFMYFIFAFFSALFVVVRCFEINLPKDQWVLSFIREQVGKDILVNNPTLPTTFIVLAVFCFVNGWCFARLCKAQKNNMPNGCGYIFSVVINLIFTVLLLLLVFNRFALALNLFDVNALEGDKTSLYGSIFIAAPNLLLALCLILNTIRAFRFRNKIAAVKKYYR